MNRYAAQVPSGDMDVGKGDSTADTGAELDGAQFGPSWSRFVLSRDR